MAHGDYDAMRDAILSRQQIVAFYDGYLREMCPHVIGTKGSLAKALFYQFGGASKSGLAPDGSPNNWRCIPIDGLSDVSVRPGEWHTAENYDPATQRCVDEIDVSA